MNSDKTPPNIPDYEDLAFEPALTWRKLCCYAKKRGAEIEKGDTYSHPVIHYKGCMFIKNGYVWIGSYGLGKRNFEKMKTIIDDLTEMNDEWTYL